MGKIADRFAKRTNPHRAEFVKLCKEIEKVYIKNLDQLDGLSGDEFMAKFQDLDRRRIGAAGIVAARFIVQKQLTEAEVKDAAWEAFNGLFEATCILRTAQNILGRPLEKVNPSDFIMKMPA